jgi:Helix-turn-helix domain
MADRIDVSCPGRCLTPVSQDLLDTSAAIAALRVDDVPRMSSVGRSGLALVALSVVEQRLDVVRAVLRGADVVEVAAQVGVSRQSVHAWMGRYLSGGVAGLADRSSRPRSCPEVPPCSRTVRVGWI